MIVLSIMKTTKIIMRNAFGDNLNYLSTFSVGEMNKIQLIHNIYISI